MFLVGVQGTGHEYKYISESVLAGYLLLIPFSHHTSSQFCKAKQSALQH